MLERDKEGENACKGAYTLFTCQRERDKEREGGKREREREKEKEGEKEGWREGERERERECENLFLKGMTGALAPFSSLVHKE